MSQKESECCNKCETGEVDNGDYKCNCPCHYQNESEWERKLLDLVDNKEAGYMDFSELIREVLSTREKEIAEEVEKIIQEEKKYRASTFGLRKVLDILKHQ